MSWIGVLTSVVLLGAFQPSSLPGPDNHHNPHWRQVVVCPGNPGMKIPCMTQWVYVKGGIKS